MKSYFRILNAAVTAVAAVVALCSCTSEVSFDEESFDTTVNVGGDAFSLPLGSTAEMTLGDYMDLSEGDVIHIDENGNYYIEFIQSFEQIVSMSDFAERLTIEGLVHELDPATVTVPDKDGLEDASGEDAVLDLGVNEEFAYEFGFEEARGNGLVRIDRLNLGNASLQPKVRLFCDRPLPESLRVQVQLKVPSRYEFEDSPMVDGQIVTFTGDVDGNGQVSFRPLTLSAIEFDNVEGQEQSFTFVDEFEVVHFLLYLNADDMDGLSGSSITADLTVTAGSEDGYIYPESFIGRVDVNIDPVNDIIELKDVPDVLKSEDARLDFYSPSITASLSSNSSVRVNMDADIVPVFPVGGGNPLFLEMSTPVSSSSDVTEISMYWISTDRPSDLAPEYEWIEADVKGLLERIPDAVEVNVLASTDSEQDALIECYEDYVVSGEFEFNIPFSFGENFNLTVCDTIYGMPAILSSILRASDVTLSGEIKSTMPVDVNLSACFLDSLLNRLDIPVTEQPVNSTGADLSPVVTPLNITASRTDFQNDIYAIVLTFNLLPGEVPGISLSAESSVQADIVLKVPGGITFDINQ